ncbi:hypothetical protein SAMN05444392_11944 [Seinonella peptonophila]|uniref:Uncharacterized protein n=1 Tax=Seinonella peptonophila TaxID=112248 RepID=A0A1M5B8W3_9BACL|nr:hypothetical protein [Seinonella peptonophila]SHF38860.1 hypothetical protein SAMN05444392_11944 [Seinonella peptonophila]
MILSDELIKDLSFSWRAASFEERMEMAERIEDEQAKQQNRRACPIEISQNIELVGAYTPKKETIALKPMLLSLNDYFPLLYILIHEGRHFFQHLICKGMNTETNQKINLLKKNLFESGYLRKTPDYVLQPAESDAYSYSLRMLGEINETVQSTYGSDYRKKIFLKHQQQYLSEQIDQGRKKYGNDYPKIIAYKVNTKDELFNRFLERIPKGQEMYLSALIEDFMDERLGRKWAVGEFQQLLRKTPFKKAASIPEYLQPKDHVSPVITNRSALHISR